MAELLAAEQVSTERIPLNVEVCLKPESCIAPEQVKSAVEALLRNRSILHRDGPLPVSWQEDPVLAPNVSGIAISGTDEHRPAGGATAPRVLLFWQLELRVLVYQLHEDGAAEEVEGEDELATYREWALPGRETHGLWEALMYDGTLKRRLLRYAASALHFADRQVDAQLVSWNRVVLLHGPPGTGKTSLCKALAHKLAIKLSHRYTQSQLVEVNAHSLFSKWFSESGKLVTKLFTKITELVEDEDSLVFVLIDEVESLTAARTAAVSGSEPSDAIRVVNALLTQLDALKNYPNVMVLTTTNITQAVDLAFVDRADLKVYIGPPNTHARYEILKSCLVELQRVGIIKPEGWELPAFTELQSPMDALSPAAAKEAESPQPSRREGEEDDMCMDHGTPGAASQPSRAQACGAMLLSVAQEIEGFSGRILRKLPFLAHTHLTADTVRFEEFVHALRTTCELERADRASLT